MNDYWNDPPYYAEPPEWYMEIEELADDERLPQSVSKALLKALEDWCEDENRNRHIEPPDDPKEIEGDYWRDVMQDRKIEEQNTKP